MSQSVSGAQALAVAAITTAALLLGSCSGAQDAKAQAGGEGPTAVGVMTAKVQPVTLTTELPGRTSPFLVAEVRPQVGGIIKSRLFTEGSVVSAGQALYQIDPSTYQAQLSSAEAGLAQAQAGYTAAKLKADRMRSLVALNAVSKQENDEAQAAAQQGAANVAAQRAAVQQARINLSYTRVTAPISGRIGRSAFTPGALLTAGQVPALATVQRLDPIYVDVTQTSADLLEMRREIAAGELGKAGEASVRLILEDGATYPLPGKLAFSEVEVDPATGSVAMRAVFPNPQGLLLPGMYVRARVERGVARNGMMVPQGAVSRDAKGQASAMVVAGGKAEPRLITVSQTIGDQWLVTGGLKAGDKIIVQGLQKVRPGAPVAPMPLRSELALAAPSPLQR